MRPRMRIQSGLLIMKHFVVYKRYGSYETTCIRLVLCCRSACSRYAGC